VQAEGDTRYNINSLSKPGVTRRSASYAEYDSKTH
jgi:hypothetical protein